MLEPGDTAPDFTLPDQHGEPVSLSGLRGRHVVLYFYPKAMTPGCTTQACCVRDRAGDYERAGATFPLLSDGVVREAMRKVRPAEHDDRVLGALSAAG